MNNTKKILMENDRIIINNYWGYLGDKYLLYLGPLIFFGVLIKIAIVVNQKLIINVGRNFILFFITLILCSLLTYYMLLGNTITLEQTANNSIVCEIKYTFLGVDKLVVNRLTLQT